MPSHKKKCQTHWEPTRAGARAPLSSEGGSRQGRRSDGGELRLVVGEVTGWSNVVKKEVREGSSKDVRGEFKK